MRTDTIDHLVTELADSGELVLPATHGGDPLLAAWRAASADAREAYAVWCAAPSALTHAAYVALADQADAAAVTLAADRASAPATAGPHAPRRLAA